MLFLIGKCALRHSGDTEQNGAEHFTVARRAIVTCFRRVMIVFAGICKGKTQNRNVLRASKKVLVFFCGARSTLRFRVFPCKCQPNQS